MTDKLKPDALGVATLETTIRELLQSMIDQRLSHAILVLPNIPSRITVTICRNQEQADAITRAVKAIIG